MIRKLLTGACLLFACTLLGAQPQEYFNTNPGRTLKWTITKGSGELFGYCHENFLSASGDRANGAVVKFSYMFYDAARKSVIGKDPFVVEITVKDGSTSVYANSVSKAIKSGDYMTVGDLSSVPPSIKVGDILPDNDISVNVKDLVKTSNSYRKRKVSAKETVSVPAGSFECMLIEDDEYYSKKGPFHVKSWVCPGLGIVRQEIRNPKGELTWVYVLTDK